MMRNKSHFILQISTLGLILLISHTEQKPSQRHRTKSWRERCIGGEKCDECARGFVQGLDITPDHPVLTRKIPENDLPRCIECGECFNNWDRILSELKNQTQAQVAKAERVKVTGVTGVYTRTFEEMENNLRKVKDILNGASISNDELVAVQGEIDRINAALRNTTGNLDALDGNIGSIRQSILRGSTNLDQLRTDADRVKLAAQEMKDEITTLQEANVEGALNLTQVAKEKSQEAAYKVKGIEADRGMLADAEYQRKATEKVMNNSREQFSSNQIQNKQKLREIIEKISSLEEKVPELNEQICDGSTSTDEPCDELCGGAGCGKCGGLSCLNGALSKAEQAVKSAQSADEILVEKDDEATRALRDVFKAHQESAVAARDAQAAYDMANQAKNLSMGEMSRVNDLVKEITDFRAEEKATPEGIAAIADECLEAEMEMNSGEILDLANQINVAIDSVTNVDEILAETAEDVAKAVDLKARADLARQNAEEQLAQAQNVTDFLSKAVDAQSKADVAIQSAQGDIDAARKDLSQIQEEMTEAINSADTSVYDVRDLSTRQQTLQTNFIKNENHITSAREAAEMAKDQASNANKILYELNKEFKNVSDSLESKTSVIGQSKYRAVDLQKRANELATSASNKMASIRDVESEYEETERRLMQLSEELVRLNCEMSVHLQVIEDKSNFYRTCSPPSSWSPSTTCQCLPGASEPACNARREAVVYNEDTLYDDDEDGR